MESGQSGTEFEGIQRSAGVEVDWKISLLPIKSCQPASLCSGLHTLAGANTYSNPLEIAKVYLARVPPTRQMMDLL